MDTQFQKDWQLFLIARTGDVEAAQKALKEGANPNFIEPQNQKRPSRNRSQTTLFRTVSYGHRSLVELLLNSGATLPAAEQEQQHLLYAAQCVNSSETLDLLLRRGLHPTREVADWALKNGHKTLYNFIRKTIGEYKIQYDIDSLLKLEPHYFYHEFCLAIPSSGSMHNQMLFPEELVLRSLWEFTVAIGSEFKTMVDNELINNRSFATLHHAYSAFLEIGENIALKAVSELVDIMSSYGFSTNPTKNASIYLSDDDFENLEKAVEHLDSIYFTGDAQLSLWKNPYLRKGMEYAERNIQVFRTRK